MEGIDAVIFDLDGVVTRTARLHARAWQATFDPLLAHLGAQPFDPIADYRRYVDGKPRRDGVRSFLAARGIPATGARVARIALQKDAAFRAALRSEGVAVFDGTVAFIRGLRARGVKTAVVTASRNCDAVLAAAGLEGLFDVRVDGNDAARLGLAGKPAPDTFLHAAAALGVTPARAAVVEDALAGVEAGSRGGFALVIGVDRAGQADALCAHGATRVVGDLAELAAAGPPRPRQRRLAAAPGVSGGWVLEYGDFRPETERLREALCTLGNGYFATRGAAPEASAGGVHYPGTYLAGGYDRQASEIAGRTLENEDLVNLPNWLALGVRIDGAWFDLAAVQILAYRQALDLASGILERTVRFRDAAGRRTRLEQRRLVHMGQPHLAALETVICAEDWSGPLTLRAALDGRVENAGVARYRELARRHLEPLEARAAGGLLFLKMRTLQSRLEIAMAARTRVSRDARSRAAQEPGYVAHEFDLELVRGEPVRIEKVVALYSSRDRAVAECGEAARAAAMRAGDFAALAASHAEAWARLWRRFDLELEDGGADTHLVLRLHLFHLLQTASPHVIDLDVGVPARGLHGEAYRGHVFWDELFIFPLLNLRLPEITRALLMYRYRRLGEARAAARAAGCRGAMYPWQSGASGREESQRVHLNPRSGRWVADHTLLQRHVGSAIAYNVWQYYQVTRDLEFLAFYGAEMFLEIARFWASFARFNEGLGRYEITGVAGPDEFHTCDPRSGRPGLDNHAYTSVMAAWVLGRAFDVLAALPEERRRELREGLGLDDAELARWRDVGRRLRIAFHDGGIISQFEGYETLAGLDWAGYRARYGDIHRLDRILEAEGDDVNRYQASKQADVLMLFYLFSAEELEELFGQLGYEFAKDTIPRNVAYYAARTSHGSTLSRVVDSWVLARSDRAGSWRVFREALHSDVADTQGGTTAEGIHLGAMAGTVDLVQRGYTGIVTRGDTLWLNPRLPDELGCLRLTIRYRGLALDLKVTRAALEVHARASNAAPIALGIVDRVVRLAAGERHSIRLAPDQISARGAPDNETVRSTAQGDPP